MYTTKSGKTYANPQYGKAMDQADTKPDPKSKKDSPKRDDSKDSNTPTVRIVIETDPSGSGYTTDAGDGLESHADKSSLMDHLASTLPDDGDDDSTAADSMASAAPSSGLMDAIKGMTSK